MKHTEKNAAVIAEALTWLGTPYRHQGSKKGVGCDCLGLVRGVWRAVYGGEPEAPGPYSADWAEAGGEDALLAAARRHCREKPAAEMAVGDLLVFRWRTNVAAKHVGILVELSRFVHAYEGNAVVISALVPSWRKRVAGVFGWPAAASDLQNGGERGSREAPPLPCPASPPQGGRLAEQIVVANHRR